MRLPTIRLRAAALAMLTLAACFAAQAQSAPGFGRLANLRVDVGPMVAQGDGPRAEALRADLLDALRRSFADRMVGGSGPRLVVRVRSLSLQPYAGSQSGRGWGGGGGQSDYLDGEALLIGSQGEVLARHPQLSALPASSGGAWYDPASERRRLAAIAEHYAQWLSRSLPVE